MAIDATSMRLPTDNTDMTLEEAREHVAENAEQGTTCPCCGRLVRVYKRKLNSGMVSVLFKIVKIYGQEYVPDRWVHIHDIFGGGAQNHRDWSLLQHWGLIQQKPPGRSKEENSSGYWRPTKRGVYFLLNKTRVPRYFFSFDNTSIGYSEETTSVREALGDKFDYAELMRGLV